MAALRAPTPEEVLEWNPALTREQAERVAGFAAETLEHLTIAYGSIEEALKAPGRPWSEVKKELGLGEEDTP